MEIREYLIGNGVYTFDSAISPSLSRLDLHWVGVCFYIIFSIQILLSISCNKNFVQSVYHPITNKLSSHDFHFLKDWNYTVIIKGELTKDFGIILEALNKLEHEVIDQKKKKRLNCVIERLKINTSLTFIDPNCCLVLYYFQNKWCLMLRRSIIISYTENISHCRDSFFFGAL